MPKHGEAEQREENAGHSARDGEKHALGEELPHETLAPGAERDAHGELLSPRNRAREERAGEIRAGDEQDEPRARHEHEERRARISGHRRVQRHGIERNAAIIARVFAREIVRECDDFIASGLQGHARLETRDESDPVRAARSDGILEEQIDGERKVGVGLPRR